MMKGDQVNCFKIDDITVAQWFKNQIEGEADKNENLKNAFRSYKDIVNSQDILVAKKQLKITDHS